MYLSTKRAQLNNLTYLNMHIYLTYIL